MKKQQLNGKILWVLQKCWQAYVYIAVSGLTVCVLFGLLNVGVMLYLRLNLGKAENVVEKKYNIPLNSVYPDLSQKQIDRLLGETWGRPLQYDPFCQFKEIPFTGTYLNIDVNGFRKSIYQEPWPPSQDNVNIFVFGGSTTFGYGVADGETIPSYLVQLLQQTYPSKNAAIYNFGRADFYSSQERVLFEKILVARYVPDLAIFIDGLNDFSYSEDEPQFTQHLRQMMPIQIKPLLLKGLRRLPLGEILLTSQSQAISQASKDQEAEIERILARYIDNKKIIDAISSEFGCQAIFVWQPIPYYKYDLQYHVFKDVKADLDWGKLAKGYLLMAEHSQTDSLGDNFLWCADIQEKMHEPLYVDAVHYSAGFSRYLAEYIVNSMIERHLSYAFEENIG